MIFLCATNIFLLSFFFLQPSSLIYPPLVLTCLPGYAVMAVDSLQVAGILSVYEGYSQNRHDSSRWRHVRRRHCLERYFHFRYVHSSVRPSVRLLFFFVAMDVHNTGCPSQSMRLPFDRREKR